MFIVMGCMVAGILIGYAARRIRFSWVPLLTTGLIWVLLFLLGWEVGHNREVISTLPSLGGNALLLTLAALSGSCLAAWGLWKKVEFSKHVHFQEQATEKVPAMQEETKDRKEKEDTVKDKEIGHLENLCTSVATGKRMPAENHEAN